MPENTATATAAPKSTFKPEHKFDFQGPKATLPIYTREINRGVNAGNIVFSPDVEKINFSDLPNLWDVEDVMEEIIRPAISKLSLAIHKIALAKNSKFTTDETTKEKTIIPGSTDMQAYQRDYNNLLERLTTQSESTRALKLKSAELIKKMMEFSGKMGTSNVQGGAEVEGSNDWLQLQFFNTAKELAAVNQQIEDSKAKKEANDTTDASA